MMSAECGTDREVWLGAFERALRQLRPRLNEIAARAIAQQQWVRHGTQDPMATAASWSSAVNDIDAPPGHAAAH